jgi:hypothetical protein
VGEIRQLSGQNNAFVCNYLWSFGGSKGLDTRFWPENGEILFQRGVGFPFFGNTERFLNYIGYPQKSIALGTCVRRVELIC